MVQSLVVVLSHFAQKASDIETGPGYFLYPNPGYETRIEPKRQWLEVMHGGNLTFLAFTPYNRADPTVINNNIDISSGLRKLTQHALWHIPLNIATNMLTS